MTDALATWHRAVAEKNAHLLQGLIADDAVMLSPVVHTPQVGKAITIKYLTAALTVLNNENFRYVGKWSAPNSAVLEFNTEIDGILIDGADFITWNDAGQIVEFRVMVRPLKAINILMQKMGVELAKL